MQRECVHVRTGFGQVEKVGVFLLGSYLDCQHLGELAQWGLFFDDLGKWAFAESSGSENLSWTTLVMVNENCGVVIVRMMVGLKAMNLRIRMVRDNCKFQVDPLDDAPRWGGIRSTLAFSFYIAIGVHYIRFLLRNNSIPFRFTYQCQHLKSRLNDDAHQHNSQNDPS